MQIFLLISFIVLDTVSCVVIYLVGRKRSERDFLLWIKSCNENIEMFIKQLPSVEEVTQENALKHRIAVAEIEGRQAMMKMILGYFRKK